MRRITSFVAVFVMLIMTLPALACATAPKMSRMEHDCCEQMHGKCGDMAKQGCCQIELHTDLHQLPSLTVSAPTLHVVTVAILHSLLLAPPAPVEEGPRWRVPSEHPPPGLLIASTTVLRV